MHASVGDSANAVHDLFLDAVEGQIGLWGGAQKQKAPPQPCFAILALVVGFRVGHIVQNIDIDAQGLFVGTALEETGMKVVPLSVR